MSTNGVLYIATGEKYVQGAIYSAQTVLKHCPGLAIHLFTDSTSQTSMFKKHPLPFTEISMIVDPYHRSKVDYISKTPFDRTLFLDTDTAINKDIREMFQILDRFDIAMVHAHHRSITRLEKWRLSLPSTFPEFNTGVVLYRKTPDTIKCLEEWGRYFREYNQNLNNDQTILRELLWSSDLRIATLPPEYNVRFLKYHLLWSKTEAESKIFHLKALHMGWSPWIKRKILAVARMLGLGWLINLVRKIKIVFRTMGNWLRNKINNVIYRERS